MINVFALVALGTAATVLAILLSLLRIDISGSRPLVALTRQWVAAGRNTSAFVVIALSAIAACCFVGIWTSAANNSASVVADASQSQSSEAQSDDGSRAALEALRAYANSPDGERHSTASAPTASSVQLPDVDTMISQLVARLEKQPNDVKGWKMLAWSYLNVDRPDQAARAYQTALDLEPADPEIKKGLETAKSAAERKPLSADAQAPSLADHSDRPDSGSAIEQSEMIRQMVDWLAARLETSPHDEDGWTRLIRSRVTLGEQDAAKAALEKALTTFASDPAVKERLKTAARSVGLETD